MPVDEGNIFDVFTYHSPEADQLTAYKELRQAAMRFTASILAYTPKCADQQAAIRHVREASMTANAAIALKGKI